MKKKTILKWIFGVIAALLVLILLVAGGWRSEAGCSLTAVHFYEKLGYPFKNGVTVPDRDGVGRMEKRKEV